MSRVQRVGGALLVLYVTVCVATIGLSGRHIRPLFEGIGPTAPYQWVNPPPQFAPGNVHPSSSSTDIPLASTATPFQAGTSDAQAVITIPAHDISPPPGTTSVRVAITPVDPAKLGRLPPRLVPAGNAYQIAFSYQPSGASASPLAQPGDLILAIPEPVSAIAYSSDGRTWTTLVARSLGSATSVGTPVTKAGWYLGAADVATSNPGLAPRTGAKPLSSLLIAAVTVGLIVALVTVPLLLRRRAATRRGRTSRRSVPPRRHASKRPRR